MTEPDRERPTWVEIVRRPRPSAQDVQERQQRFEAEQRARHEAFMKLRNNSREKHERQKAAELLRVDPANPTEDELNRERRERYAAERKDPTGLLAVLFRAYEKSLAEEEERIRRETNLHQDDDDESVTTSAPVRQMTAEADFDYHSIALNGVEPDYEDKHLTDQRVNALVTITRTGLVIHSGIASGPVRLNLHAATQDPQVSLDDWEAVVEVPISTPTGRIEFEALFTDGVPDINMATAGPGTYQVRIGNRGYNIAYDLAVDEAVEDILIQVWPTDAPITRVIRLPNSRSF